MCGRTWRASAANTGCGGRSPATFPRLGVLPCAIALLGAEQPWIGAFCRQVMELNFALDTDINQPDRMATDIDGAGPSGRGHSGSGPG